MTGVIDRALLDFWLWDWLDAGALLTRAQYGGHDRGGVNAMLDTAARLADSHFLDHWKTSDREEPRLENGQVRVLPAVKRALATYAEAGFAAASFAPAHGGLGLPSLICTAITSQFMAANIATASYAMLTAGNAALLTHFGNEAQVNCFALPQIEGRWTGTMCLSEPQAGSSLGDITTRAVPDGEDHLGPRYRLTGNKMWISGGDHDAAENIVHLVLAKIPGVDEKLIAGPKGISIFIVPKYRPDAGGNPGARNDIAVAGLNHKMGFRGTSNCLLNFGETGGALGWRVGDEGQGLAVMFHMMNGARIGVGLGAGALGYRGYRLALDYARTRTQGRAPGAGTNGGQVPIIEHADIRRMLLAAKSYTEGALALSLWCARLEDEERSAETAAARAQATAWLGLLTPVAKTWPSEYGLAANDIAIQIHGGYGYTRDFDVEQLYRDNRLNPIHEGTTGIQALDLLGRKLLRDEGAVMDQFFAHITTRITGHALAPQAETLRRAMADFRTALAGADTPAGQAVILGNATPMLWAFGHIVMGFIWLDLAGAARKQEKEFAQGQIATAIYFCAYEIPKISAWLSPVIAGVSLPVEMKSTWF
ncbi:MAG: acyl-CoA dehydrogenase [Acidocella sp.]|nr:acyl-CoA dehydrogenase [Acidocella sp.]